jgi:hypothetical protein
MKKSKQEQIGCIYHSVNLKNDMGYVGQHKNVLTVLKRWKGHVGQARKGCKSYFHSALRKNKYEEGFSWEVIWTGPISRLNEMETYYIAKLHTFVDDPLGGGYNLTRGGGQHIEFGAVARNNMRKAQLKRFSDPAVRASVAAACRKTFADPEVRAYVSSQLKAKHAADPDLRKRCARPRTAKFKANTSKMFKRLWEDPVWRANHGANVGKKKTPAQKQACSERAKAQWANKESRAKLERGLQNMNRAPQSTEVLSQRAKSQWADRDYRSRQSKSRLASWARRKALAK